MAERAPGDFASCVRAALLKWLEERKTESEKLVQTCPPMAEMLDLTQKIADKAGDTTHKKRELKEIRKKVLGIAKSFRVMTTFKALKQAVQEPVASIHTSLNKADQIIDQYGGRAAEGWVEKKFLARDKFDIKYKNLMKELVQNENRLATAIKIVKDALKAGEITDADEDSSGGLTESTLKAFNLVNSGIAGTHVDSGLAAVAKAELDEEYPDDVSEAVDPADIAPSDAGVDTAMADMLAQERGTGRQAVKADTILGAAFVGDFWKVVEFWDGEDAESLNESGRTYAPLHQAVFWESLEGVVLLTSRGANPNIQTARECPVLKVPMESTPLHLAATIGNAIIVKQLICDGADPNAVDAKGAKPIDVAGTAACRAALEDAADMREKMERFAEMIEDGDRWDEALQWIKGADGLPANVLLPPGATELREKYHPIQKAAIQGNIAAYAKLVYSGALPIQIKPSPGGEADPPREGPAAEPSCLCDDELKPLFQMIERMCKEPPSDRLPPIPDAE